MSAHVPLGEQLEMGPRPLNAGRGFAPCDAFVARHQQGTPSTSSLGHVPPAPKYISGRGGQAALKNGDLPLCCTETTHSSRTAGSCTATLSLAAVLSRCCPRLIAAAVTNHATPPHARAPTPLTHPAAEDVSLHDAHRRKICSP